MSHACRNADTPLQLPHRASGTTVGAVALQSTRGPSAAASQRGLQMARSQRLKASARCALPAAVLVFVLLALGWSAASAAVQRNPANGHHYEWIDGMYTWDQANSLAAARSHLGYQGHLVTITSQQENDFVASIVPYVDYGQWIGGHYSTGWITGEPMTYTNWTSAVGDGDCMAFMTSASPTYPNRGQWQHQRCVIATLQYVVEFDTPQTALGVTVSSPNGGEYWCMASTHDIIWSSTSDAGITGVDIYYSTDNGVTYPTAIATNVANTGTYPWTLPIPLQLQARIKIVVHDAIGQAAEDVSDAGFFIRSPIVDAYAGSNGSISPNGAIWVTYGSSQTFQIQPAAGYQVSELLVDGSAVQPETSYTFANVTSDHLIQASFSSLPRTMILYADGSGDYSNIEEAIAASATGDTIVLADGIFRGPGNRDLWVQKGITIRSMSDDPTRTVVDCDGTPEAMHNAFNFSSAVDNEAILRGVGIQDGYASWGGGIAIHSGALVRVANCRIAGCTSVQGSGGGLYCQSDALIDGCAFVGNIATNGSVGAGALVCESAPAFNNCTFENNVASDTAWGGGVGCYAPYSAVGVGPGNEQSAASSAAGDGGARRGDAIMNIAASAFEKQHSLAKSAYSPSFLSCSFVNNIARSGGGLFAENMTPVVRDCVFRSNHNTSGQYSNGGGLMVEGEWGDAGAIVEDCTFSDNSADLFGGGVHFWEVNGDVEVIRCVVDGNRSTYGAGMYCRGGSGFSAVDSCSFKENYADENGGGLNWEYQPHVGNNIRHCVFFSNGAQVCAGGVWGGRFLGCTFVGNHAPVGAAVYMPISNNTSWEAPGNIVAFNRGGLAVEKYGGIAFMPSIVCTDVYGNELGDWVGGLAAYAPSVTNRNLSVDPLFCNLAEGELTLCTATPCQSASCNLFGALSVGCAGPDRCPPSVALTSPNGGELWGRGTGHDIRWVVTGTSNTVELDLLFSSDDGATYPDTIATAIPNTGMFDWHVPEERLVENARVKIIARTAFLSAADHSDGSFVVGPTITATASTGGVIQPSGQFAVAIGDTQAVTITPDVGWHVEDVLVDGVHVGALTQYTFAEVTADHTIAASFAPGVVLAVEAWNGTVEIEPNLTHYDYGDSVSLRAVPASAFAFSGWSGDAAETTNPLVVVMDRNKTIAANFAAMSISADANFWTPDGPTLASAVSGDTVYIGGDFSVVGPQTGCSALFDSGGMLVPGWPKVDGTVYAVISDGADGWYIGGKFDAVGGVPRCMVARIRGDYTVDSWVPDIGKISISSDAVWALALSGDVLYVGGTFGVNTIGGLARRALAAFNTDSGQATTWNPTPNDSVRTIVVSGNTVFVGGLFNSVSGQSRRSIAAIDVATGQPTSWNPGGTSGYVWSIAPRGGTVYVGGAFSSMGGQSRRNVAAIDLVTGLATDWNPDVNWTVWALFVTEDEVYIGGNFTTVGGQIRNRLAAVDPTTGQVDGWNPNANNEVLSLVLSGATVYVAGRFTMIGEMERYRCAALDAATGQPTDWHPNIGRQRADALAVNTTTVVVGGDFLIAGGVPRSDIAALDALTGRATNWDPHSLGPVKALAVDGGTVYAGGDFSSIGGQVRNRIAALDAITGQARDWDPNANGAVNVVIARGATVYAGGTFTNMGGQVRNYVAALDANTGRATEWNPDPNGEVCALVVEEGTAYVGGAFTSCGHLDRNRIAAVDVNTGQGSAWNPGADAVVRTMELCASTIIAGGDFTNVGGAVRNRIAAISTTDGSVSAWNPNANGVVRDLAVCGAVVYAGGDFTTVNGQPRNRIVALRIDTGQPSAWDAGASQAVCTISVWDHNVIAGMGSGPASLIVYPDPISPPPMPQPAILSPNGGEAWTMGSVHAIAWSAPTAVLIDLYCSVDGGLTHPTAIVRGASNSGSYSWTTPNSEVALASIKLVAHDQHNQIRFDVSDASFTIGAVSGVCGDPILSLALSHVQPNPASESAQVACYLPVATRVEVSVYDIRGRRVAILADDMYEAGRHEVIWSGANGAGRRVGSGVYFIRMRASGRTFTQRVTLLR